MVFPLLAFLSPIVSAVSAAVASIGPAVAGFCANVLPTLAIYIEKGLEVMKMIAQVANTLATAMGIFQPDEAVDDMGDRALQAAEQGIVPDQFDSHAEYVDALRCFDLDPYKNKDKPLEKIVAGLAVVSSGLDDKLGLAEGTSGQLFPLVGANPDYFSGDRLTQYLKSGQDIAAVADYFAGKLGGAESLDVEDGLVDLEKNRAPEQDDTSIRARLYQAQSAIQATEP